MNEIIFKHNIRWQHSSQMKGRWFKPVRKLFRYTEYLGPVLPSTN